MVAMVVLSASCALLSGPDPTRFYVLPSNVPDGARESRSLVIGLGPVTMPGYLAHPGLATRAGTQVRYADLDRWAEPLPTLFARTLGEDLSALLGARIVPHPWFRGTPLDVVVRVDVKSFEADGVGHVVLDACWTIREPPATSVRGTACASIVEPVEEDGARAEVATLGRTVGELARRVASAIRSYSGARTSSEEREAPAVGLK
jgi:uncharacterized lipoprotein YmbA